MNAAARPIRQGWAIYLSAYGILFAVFLYVSLQFVLPIGLVQVISTLLDVFAMACLYRYVRRQPITSVSLRIAVMAIALLLAARTAVVLHLLVPHLLPWLGGVEQWASLVGMCGSSFQIPMVLALFMYAMDSQG
ncbi:hypothetical protein ABIC89_002693 [Variovorax boronicumulans]|uniref:hypothetical protein n=1 Tax=Variovorax boronicumulans TaxID=436515 RepID=UPI0033976864